jgi:DNA-binding transcriptional regulator LsrR (DeoR family)
MIDAEPTDTDLLVRASRLYYLEERGQAEIARLLRISRNHERRGSGRSSR